MNSIVDDPAVRVLLDRLHDASDAQIPALDAYFGDGRDELRPTGREAAGSATRDFFADKYVAIDRDKGELCYALCRAAGARRVVEAGTSFGVSTLYLAAAVRDNGGGLVTTCDIEASKVAVARGHFAEAGLAEQIEVRLGDIRETLASGLDGDGGAPVDVLLLDIWAPMAGPVMELVSPHLRVGGMVIADNSAARRRLYGDLFAHLHDPANGFTTMTLPYDGGLELAVRTSPRAC